MKKFLLLFILLDFVFVGIVLTISKPKNRSISSLDQPDATGLSEGQRNKWNLIETFKFQTTQTTIELETDKLQMICETSSLIELRFLAQNTAIDGMQPTISHVYSCDALKKDLSLTKLTTFITDFKSLHHQKTLTLAASEMKASQIYSTEEFPSLWKLAEIKISGPSSFTINEFEIKKVLQRSFDFNISDFTE